MSAVLELVELGFPWEGTDPFIFTVHHVDYYPAGNDALGPDESLLGRNLGAGHMINGRTTARPSPA